MCKTYCANCNDQLEEDEIRWAHDESYCDDCFNDRYKYCERCDALIPATDAHFSSDGYPYCSECWSEDYDDDCPDNPDVDDADRQLIVELSRNYLLGKVSKRTVIRINQKDYLLPRIKEKIGMVGNPIYLYGLRDREEYQLSVSANLLRVVKEHILLNGMDWKVTEGKGINRVGIAYTIRQENFREILKLIKSVTTVREAVIL